MAHSPGNGNGGGKDKKDGNGPPIFTIDVDKSKVQEMPSITKLLNRKKLESRSISSKVMAPEHTKSVHLRVEKKGAPKVQKVDPGMPRASLRRLREWSAADLASGQDSVRKGLALLAQKAPFKALVFLPRKTQERQTKEALPFQAVAAYGAGELARLWSGLSFSGELMPDLWKEILEAGFVEVEPSSSTGAAGEERESSSRRLFRSFLGLPATSWFSVICHGRVGECLGVVVLITKKSCAQYLLEAFPHLKNFGAFKKAQAA
jgi:hypothetical protein